VKYYIALLHKEKGTSYGIMFPDFPGCISSGDSFEEALDNGREALAFHVEGMRLDGETIPRPRSLDKIKEDNEDWIDFDNSTVAVVALLPPKGKKERVNLNLDSNLLIVVDELAKEKKMSRSAFAERALEAALDGR